MLISWDLSNVGLHSFRVSLDQSFLCVTALSIEEARKDSPGTNIEYFDEWHGEKGAPLVSGDLQHPSLHKLQTCAFTALALLICLLQI
jgi:hypothetical protein